MAQQAIDWMDRFGINYSKTRAADEKAAGSVAAWAESSVLRPTIESLANSATT
jgi:hypothetical protein